MFSIRRLQSLLKKKISLFKEKLSLIIKRMSRGVDSLIMIFFYERVLTDSLIIAKTASDDGYKKIPKSLK